ncbi:MAG: galactokinase [Bacteroidota bacterium]|nr:galactokinase [Bacteroidota bacterium]
MINTIREKFISLFEQEPVISRSPGRINLIGEHTDYNNGFVLPAAIDKAIYFAVNPRTDGEIHLYAVDLDEHYTGHIDSIVPSSMRWPDYILGSLQQLKKAGHTIKGFNGVIGGDVPLGAGLSSSAAVECASLSAFNNIFSIDMSRLTMVKLAQKAENEFVGVMCGIMDQFASAFGKKDHAIKLDCRSLEYQYVPFKLTDYDILLFDTNVEHSLASSEYNLRRQQCEEGVALIKKVHPEVNSLRDATPGMVEEILKPGDDIIYRRCSFIVNEIQRVTDACADLERGDLISFGQKMYKTHDGLSRDYEVSCKELDFLVDYVKPDPAVIGARMMGGGFGGCTINLVAKKEYENLIDEIIPAYKKATDLDLKVYVVQIENGTQIVAG